MIKPEDIKLELIGLFPEFEAQWESVQNCFREDDGSFTHAGILAEFSHFVCDRFPELPQVKSECLFSKVEDWMTCGQSNVENAVATCFLENIAGEPISNEIQNLLGPKSKKYFNYWNG